MNAFAKALNNAPDARTENGAETFSTSNSKVVDFFFAVGGASIKNRGAIDNLITLFEEAYRVDEERALRILAWTRDIRGGGGRREIFRQIMLHLENTRANVARRFIPYIPTYGRWDDIQIFKTDLCKTAAYSVYQEALKDKAVAGLAAKWAPRKGKVAEELQRFLKLSPKQYRKLVVSLSNTVEQRMCSKQWEKIEYSHVPSLASIRYAKAFNKHDAERYQAWISSLQKGETKVNVGAIYPHDVVLAVKRNNDLVAEEMWKALPNFTKDHSIMPIVDVSGSMEQEIQGNLRGIDVSISLGLYLASKNQGPFKNLFMTFSEKPAFVKLTGETLRRNIQILNRADWGYNTNLQKAFSLLLNTATAKKAAPEDMPSTILIISDMEFDSCVQGTNYENIARQYAEVGYNLPNVVFWNVAGRSTKNVPVCSNQNGVALVSGFSPAMLESVLGSEEFNPAYIVDNVIMVDRYNLWF